jgi:hypothetical protein
VRGPGRQRAAAETPGAVWIAGSLPVLSQLAQLAVSGPELPGLLALVIAVAFSYLLVEGTRWGWGLTGLWALSAVSAPLVFSAPPWLAISGGIVLIALMTRSAREFCLHSVSDLPKSVKLSEIEHRVAGRLSDLPYDALEIVTDGGTSKRVQNWLEKRRITTGHVLAGLVLALIVILPITGETRRWHEGAGRGDFGVDVVFRTVLITNTLIQFALIATILLAVRSAVHKRGRGANGKHHL